MPDEKISPEGIIGFYPFDLLAPYCKECGRPEINRWLLGKDGGGCGTCAKAITRHRCIKTPNIYSLAIGDTWECPDCGSKWTVREVEEWCPDCCADCGHKVTRREWGYTEGDRVDTAPPYDPPPVFTPFRNILKGEVKRESGKPFPGLPY